MLGVQKKRAGWATRRVFVRIDVPRQCGASPAQPSPPAAGSQTTGTSPKRTIDATSDCGTTTRSCFFHTP